MPRRSSSSQSSSSGTNPILALIGLVIALLFGGGIYLSQQPGGLNISVGSNNANNGNSGNQAPVNPNSYQFGVQAKTTGCQVNDKFPDSACTPGAIIDTATVSQICQSGYAKSVRNVTTSEKDQVYKEYGILSHSTGQYEVDHLVSLELGGSNDISNLWPEAASPQPGFHEKDKVENYLHAQVCSGAIDLKQAQIEIATNWIAVYNRMPK